MRMWGSICLLLTLVGFSAAQDTNFPVGPQYLITSGSPLLLRPIATPTLSFDSGLTPPQPIESTAEPTPKADPATYEAVSFILEAQRQTARLSIYYGLPRINAVQLVFPEAVESGPSFSIPSSVENGVVQFTSPQVLRERGYGVTLGEAAARWKTHKPSGRRVYTNDDVERLRPRD